MLSHLAIFLLCLAALPAFAQDPSEEVDTKRYSYMCLESNQDLCLGISPGDLDPTYDPLSPFYLQVKSRSRGEASRTDYKKTRWDIAFGDGKLALSRFSDLCAVKEGKTSRALLYPCNNTFPKTYTPNKNYGRWKLGGFKNDPDGAGTLELAGGASQCLTVMTCNSATEDFCDKESETIAWDAVANKPKDLRRGAYVRLRPCHYSTNGVGNHKKVQIWRQQLDCAIGCTPGLQTDLKCDSECNNAKCDWDSGRCRLSPTKSPTNPTSSPTGKVTSAPSSKSPTNQPTLSPTTRAPTVKSSPIATPTTGSPTGSPTVQCPTNGTLEYCGRFGEKMCTINPAVLQRCMWCSNACRPKSEDPRVCQIPDLFNHCLAECPPTAAVRRCKPNMKSKPCLRKKSNCVFCGNLAGPRKCFPGKDRRVCERPTLYAHCPAPAPAPLKCPARATVSKCHKSINAAQCPDGPCVWCGATADILPCRPRSKLGLQICTVKGNPIPEVFPHCPLLGTKAPTFGRPTTSPVPKPTKSPTLPRNTKSPVVARG